MAATISSFLAMPCVILSTRAEVVAPFIVHSRRSRTAQRPRSPTPARGRLAAPGRVKPGNSLQGETNAETTPFPAPFETSPVRPQPPPQGKTTPRLVRPEHLN